MKILCFLKRKPGLTREQFIEYYESRHVKLAAKLLPYFTEYKRNYIDPGTVYETGHLENRATAEPPFDVVTEMSFASPQMYDMLVSALRKPSIGDVIAADEENLFDRASMTIYVVDERVGS
jgi:hypothetical protein